MSQDAGSNRDQALTIQGFIAGVAPSAIRLEPGERSLAATAALLPGLSMKGYRTRQMRAIRAMPDCTVRLAPPEQAVLQDIRIDQGVGDGKMLDVAAWAAARTAREIRVDGGTLAQCHAVAEDIVSRGGLADAGVAARAIRLEWKATDMAEPQSSDGRNRPESASH